MSHGASSPGLPAGPPAARIRLPADPPRRRRSRRSPRALDRLGDGALHGLCILASLLGVAVIAAIAYQLIDGAGLAMSQFGLGFLTHSEWKPNFNVFGAAALLYGTAVTSLGALVLAVPIGISIGLYLSTVAHRRVRATIGPLVEMLAAIPSVILGFWGIVVLAPFLQTHLEPFLHETLGFLPIFGAPQTTGTGLFNASLILTIMVVPIIASISRDLFLTVPHELRDGATALGATRWEVVRGVMLPAAGPGLVAATFLGLGRALGEAIAVTQVIGAGSAIHASLFQTGDTLASRIADQYQGATSKLQVASLFYLGVLLLVIGLLANLAAQLIVRRLATPAPAAR
jgi:phosphate transport system permease protein